MMLLQGLIEVVDLSLWEGDVRTSHVVGLLQLSCDLLALFDKVHQFLLGLALLLEDLQFLGHLLKARIIIFFIVFKLSSSLVLFLELALAVVLVLVITIVVFGEPLLLLALSTVVVYLAHGILKSFVW